MQFNKTATYWINDLFYPVYSFWKTLYNQPHEMVKFISEKKAQYKSSEKGRELHSLCRETIGQTIKAKDEFQTGCLWYILDKTSYSGLAMIGSYAPSNWDQNFTINCITNLPKTQELMKSVKHLEITNLDYTCLLAPSDKDIFLFLDPPYEITYNLYGNNGDMHEGFNHAKFAEDVKNCNHNWMITYNETPEIKERFFDYSQHCWNLTYTMAQTKRSEDEKAQVKVNYKPGETPEKSGKRGKELLVWNWTATYSMQDFNLNS